MNKRATLLVASVLILAGCGGKEKALELERQKLTLDLMKAQNEQMATLTQKESELRALEKKNQEALQEIERQRAAIQTLQQATVQKEQALRETIADETAKLKADKEALETERESLDAERTAVKSKEVELDRRLAVIEKAREAAREAAERARRAEEGRKRPDIMERIVRRQPALEALAELTLDLVPSEYFAQAPRTTRLKQLLDEFRRQGVDEIEDEDAFAGKASEIAGTFLGSVTSWKVSSRDQEKQKVFDGWERSYLKRDRSSPTLRQRQHLVTTSVAEFFAFTHVDTFWYRVQIPNAIRGYGFPGNKGPATHEEFMEIMKKNRISLPELPPGCRYMYSPERNELMVVHPSTVKHPLRRAM
jgi:hypothetical protein